MKCRENITSESDLDSIWFTYGNNNSFLDLDVSEHPHLGIGDREELGERLLDTIDKYILEKRTFRMEEHSSSIHIKRGSDTVAKVWYDRLVNSAIKTKGDAYKVSEKLIEMLEDKKNIDYPHIEKGLSGSCMNHVVMGGRAIAKFKNRKDAYDFLDRLKDTENYNQKISKKDNTTSLQDMDDGGHSIDLFHGMGFFPSDLAHKILYCLRKYINEEL